MGRGVDDVQSVTQISVAPLKVRGTACVSHHCRAFFSHQDGDDGDDDGEDGEDGDDDGDDGDDGDNGDDDQDGDDGELLEMIL